VLSIFSLELNSRYQSSWFRFLISCGPCSVQVTKRLAGCQASENGRARARNHSRTRYCIIVPRSNNVHAPFYSALLRTSLQFYNSPIWRFRDLLWRQNGRLRGSALQQRVGRGDGELISNSRSYGPFRSLTTCRLEPNCQKLIDGKLWALTTCGVESSRRPPNNISGGTVRAAAVAMGTCYTSRRR